MARATKKIKSATVEEAQLKSSPGAATVPLSMEPPPKANTGPLHGLWALTKRDLRKWYSNPIQLFISLIQPVIWMGVFGKALNFGTFIAQSGASPSVTNAIMLNTFGTTSYFSYLACGQLSFVILFTSAFSGMSVVFDRRFGFMNKALSTPVGRGTIVMAKVFQSVGRSVIQASIVLFIAVLLGMDTNYFSVLGIAEAFGVVFLMATGLSALYVMLALRSSDWQTQMALINLLNLPLIFASNALLPVKLMPTWLQYVVKLNPVSYANDAIRQLVIGAVGSSSLAVDTGVVLAFAVVLSTMGIVLSWRLLSK
jgi:ABC-2 type transport system permease protein